MFKDNKLRLLMTLVGFSRLGEAHDPDATWIIPPSFTSEELQLAIDLTRKYEFDPPTYEDLRTSSEARHPQHVVLLDA
jgi:replication fork protection complex subunit Tof1/Swi1